MQDQEATLAAVFKALGSPVRLAILRRLVAEPKTCACDFHEVFHLAQPTVSQHLKVLRESGLVSTQRMGNRICYSANTAAIRALFEQLGELLPEEREPQAC